MTNNTAPQQIEITDKNIEDLGQPIGILELNIRPLAQFALQEAGIETVGQLIQFDKKTLNTLKDLGHVSIKNIERAINNHGYQLGTELTYPLESIFDTYKIRKLIVPEQTLANNQETTNLIPLTKQVRGVKDEFFKNISDTGQRLRQNWIDTVITGFDNGNLDPKIVSQIKNGLQLHSTILNDDSKHTFQSDITSPAQEFNNFLESAKEAFQEKVRQAIEVVVTPYLVKALEIPEDSTRELNDAEKEAYKTLFVGFFHLAAKPALECSTPKGVEEIANIVNDPIDVNVLQQHFKGAIEEARTGFIQRLTQKVYTHVIGHKPS